MNQDLVQVIEEVAAPSGDLVTIEATPQTITREGRDEMNLAEFPFALLTTRQPASINTVEFHDVVQTPEGRTIQRRWTITGSDAHGLPLATDEEVYIALMEVTREQGFTAPRVTISRYDLVHRMNWPDQGHSYHRLYTSLARLTGVTILAHNAFWDNLEKRYVTEGFHILDRFRLVAEAPGRHSAQTDPEWESFIVWNEVLFGSFQRGNIKLLDTQLYFTLRSAIARRLFRYLDKKRYDGKSHFQINLQKLAFEKLGMSRSYSTSNLRRELERVHQELIEVSFLMDAWFEGRGERCIVVYRFANATGLKALPPAVLPASAESALHALLELGISRTVARQLLDQYPLDHVFACAAECSRRLANGWLPEKSPAAWTVAAIKHPEWNVGRLVGAAQPATAPMETATPPPADVASGPSSPRDAIEDQLGIGPNTREIWEKTMAAMRSEGTFTNALHAAFLLPIRGRTATVIVPAPMLARYLASAHRSLQEALRVVVGNPHLRVRIEYRPLPGNA
jgi:hypothetical protein